MKHLMIFLCLMTLSITAFANERFVIKFQLLENKKKIEFGSTFVTSKSNTWKKGYKRSYLKSSCAKLDSGKVEKRISADNRFAGLFIAHQVVNDTLELIVTRSRVTSKFSEIRALPKNKCKAISPIIHSHTENYSFSATHGNEATVPFGTKMEFYIKIQSLNKM